MQIPSPVIHSKVPCTLPCYAFGCTFPQLYGIGVLYAVRLIKAMRAREDKEEELHGMLMRFPLLFSIENVFTCCRSYFFIPFFTKRGGSLMSNSQLWKYCTKEQCQDFILSLDLVPHSAGMSRAGEKQLACLYMLSNRGRRITIKIPDKRMAGQGRL